jgi:hypothetical protein
MISKKIKNIFIISIVFFSIFLFSNNILADDIASIEIIPEKPEPESEIEIRTFIDINGIEQVNIKIQECDIKTGLCYPDTRKNITMNKVDDNNFIATHKLIEPKASYIQYDLLVKSDLGWEILIEEEKTNLADSSINGNGNEDTPGFEIIVLFLAVSIIILLLNKRKR